jgi:hypothetical protein
LAPSLSHKYLTRIEVNGSGKHSSLLQHGNNYGRKFFAVHAPSGSMSSRFCSLKFTKNVNNPTTTEAREKIADNWNP